MTKEFSRFQVCMLLLWIHAHTLLGQTAEIKIYSALIDYSSLFEGSSADNLSFSVMDPGLDSSKIQITGSLSISGYYTTFSATVDSYYRESDNNGNGIYDFFELDQDFSYGLNGQAHYNIQGLGNFSANIYASISRPSGNYQFDFTETVTVGTSNIDGIYPNQTEQIDFSATGIHALGSIIYNKENQTYIYSLNYYGIYGSEFGNGTYSIGSDKSVTFSKLAFPSLGDPSFGSQLYSISKSTLIDSLTIPFGENGVQHVMTTIEGIPYYVVLEDFNDADDDGLPDLVDLPKDLVVKANPKTNGSIYGAGNYEEGTEVRLEAFPDNGYKFDMWTGDITSDDNPLIFSLNSSVNLEGIFKPDINDNDGDGLSNFEEIVIIGTNPDSNDTDSDGRTDESEVNNGTNPRVFDLTRFLNDQTVFNGWVFSEWLGYYFETGNDWIFSTSLGWIYDSGNSSGNSSRWFYHEGLGWLWGGEIIGSFLYSFNMQRWFFIEDDKIYDFHNELWKRKSRLSWLGHKNRINYFSGKFITDVTHLDSGRDMMFEKSLSSETDTRLTFSCKSFYLENDISIKGELIIK